MGFAEQIRLALEPAGEFLEVVFIDCLEKLGHDDRLPRADNRLPGASVRLRMFDQVVDEAAPPTPSLHSFSKSPVEFDTAVRMRAATARCSNWQAQRNACVTAAASLLG